jgi:hypothetical protein
MSGVAGVVEVIAVLRAIAADAAFRRSMPQLVDMRGVTQPTSVADLERVAYAVEQLRSEFGGARWAVLVATPAMFGVARQFAVLAERAGVEVAPFVDSALAHEWLGVAQGAAF